MDQLSNIELEIVDIDDMIVRLLNVTLSTNQDEGWYPVTPTG